MASGEREGVTGLAILICLCFSWSWYSSSGGIVGVLFFFEVFSYGVLCMIVLKPVANGSCLSCTAALY